MRKIFIILAAVFTTLTACSKNTIPTPPNHGTQDQNDPKEEPADKEAISILAIGNSFSVDAMHYLYDILKEAGYKDIHLGNIYKGSCTLSTHADYLTASTAGYTYYTNDNGTWVTTSSYTSPKAIASRKWDYISLQQASGSSGMPATYDPYLSNIIASVTSMCPDAKLMWHMTWAYQCNSTHAEFSKYGNDQMKMYNAILNCVKTKVQNHKEIQFIIPSGTAIQNARTSDFGDNLTRDGYHMSYREGRFICALMWARQIAGVDIDKINFRPSGYVYSDEDIAIIREAVNNAYAHPFEVTESKHKGSAQDVDETKLDCDDIVKAKGYKLEDYTKIDLGITPNAYYNSSNATYVSKIISAATGSTASNLNQFAATRIFDKAALPDGSLVVLRYGYQYRPEGWTALDKNNTSSSRPGNETTRLVVVDQTWWGKWNYRAFNLAKQGNPNLTAAEMESLKDCFAIYVPKQ